MYKCISFIFAEVGDNMKKKKSKGKKIAVIVIAAILVLISGTALGIALPLALSYNNNAYEEVEIIERQEDYVQPEQDPQPQEYEKLEVSEDDLGKDLDSAPKETLPKDSNATGVYGKTPIYKVAKKDPDIENILVLGTDSRDVKRERGRSDAIIIISYNKKSGSVKMVSVLRDSLVPIEGRGWNRINAAYSFDGAGLAVNTVNQILNLDIQRFVVIDFESVKSFINKVGGVDITLTQKEADYFNKTGKLYKNDIKAGVFHMNGAQALSYMRTRKLDSDFKRTGRQRNVIETLAKQILSEKNPIEIFQLTDYAFNLVKTNIPLDELTVLVSSIASAGVGVNFKIQSQHVPYSDSFKYKYYNGMAIVSYDLDEAAARVNKFLYGAIYQ